MRIQLPDGSYYELPEVGASEILGKRKKDPVDYSKVADALTTRPTTTVVEPTATPKKQMGLISSFAEGFTTLGDLPEALKYGIKNDENDKKDLFDQKPSD